MQFMLSQWKAKIDGPGIRAGVNHPSQPERLHNSVVSLETESCLAVEDPLPRIRSLKRRSAQIREGRLAPASLLTALIAGLAIALLPSATRAQDSVPYTSPTSSQ